MKKIFRSSMAVWLAAALLFGGSAMAYSMEGALTPPEEARAQASGVSPLRVELKTNKEKYTLFGKVQYTATITNISSSTVHNISAEALFDRDVNPLKGSQLTATKASLAPSESMTMSYNARLTTLTGLDVLLFPLYYLFTMNAMFDHPDNGFNDGRAYVEASKGFGIWSIYADKYKVNSTVRVWYEAKQPEDNTFRFTSFSADVTEIPVGEQKQVTFTAIVDTNLTLSDHDVGVYIVDTGALGTYLQNKGGGVFSWTVMLVSDKEETARFQARYGGENSAIVEVRFVVPSTLPTAYYQAEQKHMVYDSPTDNLGYVNNIIYVWFKEGASVEDKIAVANLVSGTIVGSTGGEVQIKIEPLNKEELEKVCKDLGKHEKIQAATYDLVIRSDTLNWEAIPDDPWRDTFNGILGTDWNESSPNGLNWWLEAIHAPSAWDYDNRFSKINIGIVDTGFDTEHEDLSISVLNFTSNTKSDHGTHVAGIIGATPNNNIGITGIVWNADLFGVDATPKTAENSFALQDVYNAFRLLLDNGAKVINFSAANETILTDTEIKSWSDRLTSWIGSFSERYRDDFIIIQAAGNKSRNAQHGGYLASMNNQLVQSYLDENEITSVTSEDIMGHIIVVGAIGKPNNGYALTSFSNYGDNVDIVAPGEDIFSTVVMGGLSGNYRHFLMSGTSQATPMVTGVAALVWSINHNFTATQVKEIVCNDTHYTASGNQLSDTKVYSVLNAHAAVYQAILETDGIPPSDFAGGTGTTTDPYLISTSEQLDAVRNDLTACYKLINDIDLAGRDWIPIGQIGGETDDGKTYVSYYDAFTGIFNGDYHAIKNMTINAYYDNGTSFYSGLFGIVRDGEIKNLGMVNCDISVYDPSAYSSGSAGSVAGVIYNSLVSNCYNSGNISASHAYASAGGIVGCIAAKSCIIDCYNTGDVFASFAFRAYAGGIAGNVDSANDSIKNCYNVGKASCTNANAWWCGGITVNFGGDIINSYCLNTNSIAVDGNSGSLINVLLLSSDQMKLKSSFVGFDFDTVWDISSTINNGYPYLRGMQP